VSLPADRQTDRQTDATNLPVPWVIWIEAGLSLWRPEFNFGAVYVGFLVEKVALGQDFLRALWFNIHASITYVI
jgi:hypothetical protein